MEEEAVLDSSVLGSEDLKDADRKCQSVTFMSGLSKEELDKPKLQRIPTPYYEHLQQTGAAAAAGLGDSEGGKGSAGSKEATPEGAPVASDPEPPAQTEPSSQDPPGDSDNLGSLRQAGPPPAKSAPSTTRRIQREFSMSRDD